jgi:hypothetical protein
MVRPQKLLLPALLWLVTAGARVARADSAATAQDLFDRALVELKLEHYDVACPALRESYRLDPQAGTLFTLAECEARAGRVASASAHFSAYLERVGALSSAERQRQAARVQAAEARREELRPLIPRLTIRVVDGAPPGSVLLLDGSQVPPVNWNVSLPLDPGKHQVELVLADGRSSSTELELLPGAALAVSVRPPEPPPPAASKPAPLPPPAAPAPPEPRGALAQGAAPVAPQRRGGHRPWSYLAFGVGGAGLLTGSVAGAILISKRNTVSDHCDGKLCDDAGYAATRDVAKLDTLANLGFGAGLLGALVGVVLVITDREPSGASGRLTPQVAIDEHSANAAVSGVF